MSAGDEAARVATRFAAAGSLASLRPRSGGHIHDSFVVAFTAAGAERRFLLQRINETVFRDCDALMANVGRVTAHLARKSKSAAHTASRATLTLVPTIDGASFARDETGVAWRMFEYLQDTVSFESPPDAARAYEAARALGAFQADLLDLQGPRLAETIPGFHDTALRYQALERAIETDPVERRTSVTEEIEFARAHRGEACALHDARRSGTLPERVVHNDAKISNVLFDAAGCAAVCVVDLDTVMPGLSLFDFGDMARSMACPAAEDEPDLSRVRVDPAMFEAVARGFLESTKPFLTSAERDALVAAAIAITLEQGVRFLTDHLAGDTYYPVARSGNNLDRARVQFKLADQMMRGRIQWERIILDHRTG